MSDTPPASLALTQLGIPHRIFIHDQPVNSLEEAAAQRGQRPEQVVRSILFQVRDGEFVLGLMAGPAQIDWKKLRQIVKRSRARMATEDEVLEVTGYRVGTVSPFGLRKQTRVLIDPSVLAEDEISIGSGIRSVAIVMKSDDIPRVLKTAEIVPLAEAASSAPNE